MIHHRTIKQIVIACIVFGFFGGIGTLLAVSHLPGRTPATPTPRSANAITVDDVFALSTASDRVDIVARITNPNPDAGAETVSYTFHVQSNGQTIRDIPGQTFILPGRQKVLFALAESVPANTTITATLDVLPPVWTFVPNTFTAPQLVVVDKAQRFLPGAQGTYELIGNVQNQSDVDFLKVDVTAIGLDTDGNIVGVGNTFVGSLKTLEKREFSTNWPLFEGKKVSTTLVFPDVNVFKADAVEQRQGSRSIEDAPSLPLVTPTP